MTDHILDLSETPAYLRTEHGQVVIEREGQPPVSLPMDDVAVIVLANPRVLCTQGVAAGLMERGGAVIVCNHRNLPVGMMLPVETHYVQTERFARQAAAALPVKKRLWKQVVRCKVRAQGRLLAAIRGEDRGLVNLAGEVRSGDPANVEAQASRRYWTALFDDPTFRRDRDAPDANRLLNYGYAVLRAVVARAICAAGLHPSLGIHHHNRYNGYCLADDLMEPYRPLVDAGVVGLVGVRGAGCPLDSDAKRALLSTITARYLVEGEARTLFQIASRTATSLVRVFTGEGRELDYPEMFVRAGE